MKTQLMSHPVADILESYRSNKHELTSGSCAHKLVSKSDIMYMCIYKIIQRRNVGNRVQCDS